VTARRLRARLDRLAPAVAPQIGQDRDRHRRRRDELFYRKLAPTGLSEPDKTEFLNLEAFFRDEDRDRARLLDLTLRQFSAEHLGKGGLTDTETCELAELERRFPPDPNHALKDSIEAWRRAAAGK
jgi:hypothetical protein